MFLWNICSLNVIIFLLFTKERGTGMSLIKCPECKSEISDMANNCPKCGFPIKKEMKEYKLRTDDELDLVVTDKIINVYYNNRKILEEPTSNFVLNYNCVEENEIGRNQHKIAFSIPCHKKSFKICVNENSDKWNVLNDFSNNIAEKIFKKDIVGSWYAANQYALEHSDKYAAGKTNAELNKIKEEIYPKKSEEEEPWYASYVFTFAMLFTFTPIGIFTMWKYHHFKKTTRIILTILFSLYVFWCIKRFYRPVIWILY